MTAPKGFQPFDLSAPTRAFMPTFTPFRPQSDRLEMQRQHAARREALRVAYETALTEWLRLMDTGSSLAVAVLALHRPGRGEYGITCEECDSYDTEGGGIATWPCKTYAAVKDAM